VNNSLFYTNNLGSLELNNVIDELRRNYALKYRDQPDIKQTNAWKH
jgi:hypothetical protein